MKVSLKEIILLMLQIIFSNIFFCFQNVEGAERDGNVKDYSDESTESKQLEKLTYYPPNKEITLHYKEVT